METFKVKPAPGVKVIDPATNKPLAAEGETKPRNKYWLRREADGDVTVIDQKPKSQPKKIKED